MTDSAEHRQFNYSLRYNYTRFPLNNNYIAFLTESAMSKYHNNDYQFKLCDLSFLGESIIITCFFCQIKGGEKGTESGCIGWRAEQNAKKQKVDGEYSTKIFSGLGTNLNR